MKTYLIIAALLTCGLVSAQRFSQQNNPNIEREHQMQGRDTGPTPEQQLDTFMIQMTADLSLNGLQEAAIRNILVEQMRQNNALRLSQQTDSQKQEEMRMTTEKTDKDIKALLDGDQLEKYEKLKMDMRAGKKNKKNKNKDKDKDKEKPKTELEPHE